MSGRDDWMPWDDDPVNPATDYFDFHPSLEPEPGEPPA